THQPFRPYFSQTYIIAREKYHHDTTMTEENFVDRLVEDFKPGVNVIHCHYIESRRRTTGSHKSRLIPNRDIQDQRECTLKSSELRRITREALAHVDNGTELTDDQGL